MFQLIGKNVVTRGLQETNQIFPLGVMVLYSLIQNSRKLYTTELPQIMKFDAVN